VTLPQLSVDITPELLENGELRDTKRTHSFADRVLGNRNEYHFEARWQPGHIVVLRRDQRGIRLDLQTIRFVHRADRIVLKATGKEDIGLCRWFDGSAMFVEHVLLKAGPTLAGRFASELPVPLDSEVQSEEQVKRVRWDEIRRRVLVQIVVSQIFGAPALRGLQRYMFGRSLSVIFGHVDLAAVERTDEENRAIDFLESVLRLSAELFEERHWWTIANQLRVARAAIEGGEQVVLELPEGGR
jgi:hypothetical protein